VRREAVAKMGQEEQGENCGQEMPDAIALAEPCSPKIKREKMGGQTVHLISTSEHTAFCPDP